MSVEYVVVSAPLFSGGPNEDAHHVGEERYFVAVVADGHGCEVDEQGRRPEKSATIAQFSQEIATGIYERMQQVSSVADFGPAFDQVDAIITDKYKPLTEREHEFAQLSLGAVTSSVLVQGENLHLVQTGDCRLYKAVSDWRGGFLLLSRDHNTNSTREIDRLRPHLRNRDFIIAPLPGRATQWAITGEPDRLFRKDPEDGTYHECLMPTRVFGDWSFRPAVTHDPECKVLMFTDELFALCSDGGSEIVKKTFAAFRGRTHIVSLKEVESEASKHLAELDDDVVIVFFRRKTS